MSNDASEPECESYDKLMKALEWLQQNYELDEEANEVISSAKTSAEEVLKTKQQDDLHIESLIQKRISLLEENSVSSKRIKALRQKIDSLYDDLEKTPPQRPVVVNVSVETEKGSDHARRRRPPGSSLKGEQLLPPNTGPQPRLTDEYSPQSQDEGPREV